MRAVLSDIHGNLEALHAVLTDVARFIVEDIYCLGDLVGFGPNPRECVELARNWRIVLMGDHDQAAVPGDEASLLQVHQGLLWTRAQLDAAGGSSPANEQPWTFLASRPQVHREGDFLFVHASPLDPLCDFIFPEDIYCERKMARIFASISRHGFSGHTHYPGIFTEDYRFLSTEEVGGYYHLGNRKTFINVGSVGQPRDDDWRACYVLLDGDNVLFRRVEYDVQTTVRKIYQIADLGNIQGDRLLEGR